MEGIPIEQLGLSVRTNNILHRMSIATIEELMEITIEELAGQRNCGVKTVEEVNTILSKLKEEGVPANLSTDAKLQEEIQKVELSDYQLDELSCHRIEELGLSTRPFNWLVRYGFLTLDRIAMLTNEDFGEHKGLGLKSKNEIRSSLQKWVFENGLQSIEPGEQAKDYNTELQEYFRYLCKMINPFGEMSWRQLIQYAEKAEVIDQITYGGYKEASSDNILALFRIPEVLLRVNAWFSSITYESEIIREIDFDHVLETLSLAFNYIILKDGLLESGLYEVDAGYWIRKRECFKNYLYKKFSDFTKRENIMVALRFEGKTLQEVADECDVTKERVRQIVKKNIRKCPQLYEDYYGGIFEYFKLSKQEFASAFPECGTMGYEYMSLRYSKGKEVLTKETLQGFAGPFVNKLDTFIKEETLRQDKQTVTRAEMVYRVLIENSDTPLSIEEFEKTYNDYLSNRGYPKDRLSINIRTVGNHLRTAQHIVFNRDNCVRYCDADPAVVWNEVDFSRYKDKVISSELIFHDYEELMEELDIRDGYELFYIIKSSLNQYAKYEEYNITCRRVPIIVLGEGSEEEQIIQLLKEISPVSYWDFYQAYEDRYGVRKETVAGNNTWATVLQNYYSNGNYIIDVPAIDIRDEEALLQVLKTKSIWYIDDLKNVFKETCVYSSLDSFNTAAFSRIGYSLRSGYAYDSHFRSIGACLENTLFSSDVIDLSELDSRILNLPSINAVIDHVKKSLDYIETAPKILMSIDRVKEQYGLDKADLLQIQENLKPYYNLSYFNANSIWKEIENDPLIVKLNRNKWMCTCILRQQDALSSLRVAGGIILSTDSASLSLSKICGWIVSKEGKMTIKNITSRFNELFGTNISYYKIADKLKSAGNWDLVISESLDEYLDDLISNGTDSLDDLFQEEFF